MVKRYSYGKKLVKSDSYDKKLTIIIARCMVFPASAVGVNKYGLYSSSCMVYTAPAVRVYNYGLNSCICVV